MNEINIPATDNIYQLLDYLGSYIFVAVVIWIAGKVIIKLFSDDKENIDVIKLKNRIKKLEDKINDK